MRITAFESTPNPNALKCAVSSGAASPTAPSPLRSYRSAEEASADPLAAALFTIDGVTNILITPSWLTIGKRPDAEWKSLKPKIKRTIEQWGGGHAD